MSKHGIDWSKAPSDATHYGLFNKSFYRDGYLWLDSIYMWTTSECWKRRGIDYEFISKKEDLGMDNVKVVKGVEDLEIGLFLKDDSGNIVVVTRACGKVDGKPFYTCCNIGNAIIAQNGAGAEYYSKFSSWSYTYSGEYTPIVKETEADRKIKELEATIELAQKQLQEYKEMK